MSKDTRRSDLIKLFDNVDESQRELIKELIDEVVFLENKMTELKALPFISVHPRKSALQKTTAAAKLYKECSQSYMNAIRILLSLLNKNESDKKDELLKRLEEFEV